MKKFWIKYEIELLFILLSIFVVINYLILFDNKFNIL